MPVSAKALVTVQMHASPAAPPTTGAVQVEQSVLVMQEHWPALPVKTQSAPTHDSSQVPAPDVTLLMVNTHPRPSSAAHVPQSVRAWHSVALVGHVVPVAMEMTLVPDAAVLQVPTPVASSVMVHTQALPSATVHAEHSVRSVQGASTTLHSAAAEL